MDLRLVGQIPSLVYTVGNQYLKMNLQEHIEKLG